MIFLNVNRKSRYLMRTKERNKKTYGYFVSVKQEYDEEQDGE